MTASDVGHEKPSFVTGNATPFDKVSFVALYSEEMVSRFLYSVLSFLVTFLVVYSFSDIYLYHISITSANHFICTNITEAFITSITTCFFLSLYLWFPYVSYSLWCFVIPTLYLYEKKDLFSSILVFHTVLYLSLFSAHYIILPSLFDFFIHSGMSLIGLEGEKNPLFFISIEPRFASYIDLAFTLYFISHFFAFFPFLFIYCLSNNSSASIAATMRSRKDGTVAMTGGGLRQWMILLCLISGSILSPPDPLFQLSISFLFFCIIEISFFGLALRQNYNRHR